MAEVPEDNLYYEKLNSRKRLIIVVLSLVIFILIGTVAIKFVNINKGAKVALREAKDVRISMRMVAIENYGNESTTSIYDATASNGLIEGAEAKILKQADADGEITLNGWNEVDAEPVAFTYQKDDYIVSYDSTSEDDTYEVYYTLPVLSY